jgi:hypothetical protein
MKTFKDLRTVQEQASPMIKSPTNEFGKKEDAFAHARQHGGKVFKKTFTHPTSGMKDVSYVVRKEEAELDEAIKKPNATTRHLRDYPVSDKDVAKPITYYSLVHKATNKVLSTHKDLESAKDEHRGMDQGERAHYRIATSTKAPKSFSMKEDAEGVAEGLNEMDKSAPQPGRDGKVSHSTYGSRDKKGSDYFKGKEAPVKPIKANQMFKYALNILKKQGVAEGSRSETEGMVSYIHHVIKNHVYPRAGDKETYMKHVAKEMPTIVKSNPKLFRRAHSIAYDRFFHVDKKDDYDHTDHSMRQGEMGHRKGMSEAGPFSYGAKPPRKGSVAYNALMKRKEQDKQRVKDIEAIGTKNHHVGVAKVTKEEIEDVAETYKYIDQSGGQVIKGKSGTYVGYTHSATKGKGANILKHNATKKYYAAGGSSTAFTQKTTLHDTPQAAARAYHKGNLAEQDEKEAQEYDYEGDMARSDLRSIIFNAQEVHDMLESNTNLPEWVQAKITKAEDYMSSVRDYMKSENTMDESWKKKLAGAALAATMAVGAHARVSADHKDDPNINRLTGKPHVTQSDEKPAAETQHRELESADKVERHAGLAHGDKVTIHHNGKSYEGHFMDKDGPRMRGGKTIKVHHAQVGIRGLGHYEAQIHPSGHAAIYK